MLWSCDKYFLHNCTCDKYIKKSLKIKGYIKVNAIKYIKYL